VIERVNRCCEQIWQVSEQVLSLNGNVILDLGFTTKEQRKTFVELAKAINIKPEIHYLDAPKYIRKKRIEKRNVEKNTDVYSFEVDSMMFNFMEPKFEAPDQIELENGCKINAS